MYTADKIRNIAIIAHVDHGKTTLVDGLISQTSKARGADKMETRVMDNMDQEKERGITIRAKNTSIYHDGYKINVVDTPGHADFGGEVERILQMVDGAILLVDAQEGPMPQTKFVLKKAIAVGLRIMVVINKIDKPGADPARTLSKVEDLFLDLGANDEQMMFETVYAIGVQGKAGLKPDALADDLQPLLNKIVEDIPAPKVTSTDPKDLQILVLSLAYDNFKGKMAVGKITSGSITKNQMLKLKGETKDSDFRASALMIFNELQNTEADEALAGEIVMVSGSSDVSIGDTITTPEFNTALPRVKIDEPTIQMTFGVNTSPFSGQDGKFQTSRQIRERLYKELETNVALRVEDHPSSQEKFLVSGRGELHLSVLIETMRREGFEMEVSRPQVIFKEEDGITLEPFEIVEIDVPNDYQGSVIQALGQRGADIQTMEPNEAHTETHFVANMPTRSIIGLKSYLLTASKGTVVMHTIFDQYAPKNKSLVIKNDHGSLISTETGKTLSYALDNAQQRGSLFIGPGVDVYEGMVIGQNSRDEDLEINPCKGKKLSNVRSSGTDDAVVLTPPRNLTLEESLEYIGDDELVEVTPHSLRVRKSILDMGARRRAGR